MDLVIMSGRLTGRPEIRRFTSSSVCNFSIAVARKFGKGKDGKDAFFIDCECWNASGDALAKFFDQGDKILITGRLDRDDYVNKQGVKVPKFVLIVEEWDFPDKKKNTSSTASSSESQREYSNPSPNSYPGDGFMNIPDGGDDDLPFK